MFNEFHVLDYGSFEKIVRSHCKDLVPMDKVRVNEITGKTERVYKRIPISAYYLDLNVLLPAGLTPDEVDELILRVKSSKQPLSETFLSKCRNNPDKLPKPIRLAYLKEKERDGIDAVSFVKSSFEDDLIPSIHGDDKKEVIVELLRVIGRDDSIPEVYREKFKCYAQKETLSDFLAEVFVYVMTRGVSIKIIKHEEAEKTRRRINPLIKRAVDEIKQFGKSSYYIPVFELLCVFAENFMSDYRGNIEKATVDGDFTLDDLIYFIEGTEDAYEILSAEQRSRFEFSLMTLARTELSRRYLEEYEKSSRELKDKLLRKYHLYTVLP